MVKRYRITADVYANELSNAQLAASEDGLRIMLGARFPLGVVEGYPDIQEIAQDSPFVAAADGTHD